MSSKSIGRRPSQATEILRSYGLTPFRGILTPGLFGQALAKTPAAKTVLIPEVVFWLMATAALADGSMAAAVSCFWGSLRAAFSWLPVKAVTDSAFCTARARLPLRFFLGLFAQIVAGFSRKHGQARRWKGFRLLGIDGTDVDLPEHAHLRRVFLPVSNQHGATGPCQARLVGLVGLWDGLCHDFRWTSLAVGEQDSARRMLRKLGPADLVLLDRNFPDKATMAAARGGGAHFLMHLPSNRFRQLSRRATHSGRTEEWYACVALPADLLRQYPNLAAEMLVRILQYQRDGFRTSWLITSLLDTSQFPYEDMVSLYHERWRQETFHREWKHALQLSNLRSHSAQGLLKEVLTQLTINNVIRWIMAEAAPPPLGPVNLSFLQAKRLILSCLPAMAAAPARLLPQLYQDLMQAIARQRITVRPGRSYPRRWDAKARPKGHGRTSAPAKLNSTPRSNHATI
jgi:hypothetical protein